MLEQKQAILSERSVESIWKSVKNLIENQKKVGIEEKTSSNWKANVFRFFLLCQTGIPKFSFKKIELNVHLFEKLQQK